MKILNDICEHSFRSIKIQTERTYDHCFQTNNYTTHRDQLLKLFTEHFLHQVPLWTRNVTLQGGTTTSDRVGQDNGTCYEGNEMSPTVN